MVASWVLDIPAAVDLSACCIMNPALIVQVRHKEKYRLSVLAVNKKSN